MSTLEEMLNRVKIYNTSGYYDHQDQRNVKQKLLSFRASLQNSYQAEWIRRLGADLKVDWSRRFRCLLNPDKLKESYDMKELSIEKSYGENNWKNGDYFYWDRNNLIDDASTVAEDELDTSGSIWLIYMQDQAEEAYFHASARRCDHFIPVNDKLYPIYMRGPSQMNLELGKQQGIEIADMSYVLHFYITDNEETKAFFERLKIVKFGGHRWRVSAVDRVTMAPDKLYNKEVEEGVITIYLEEYPDNEMEDAMQEPEIIGPDVTETHIEGPQIIKYNKEYTYSLVGDAVPADEFKVSSSKVQIVKSDSESCTLKIPKMVRFNEKFILSYGGIDLEILMTVA